jgi:hypothetical protein
MGFTKSDVLPHTKAASQPPHSTTQARKEVAMVCQESKDLHDYRTDETCANDQFMRLI